MSKYNTLLQLLLIGLTLAYPVITAENHHLGVLHDMGLQHAHLQQFMTAFQVLVAGTTAWSGLSYAFLRNAVVILGDNEALKRKQGSRGRAIIGVTFGGVVLGAAYLALTRDLPVKSKVDGDLLQGKLE
jgi:cardiolipin synthase